VGRLIYQVYPRSFADSDGDGVGDLPGLASKLDHLAWLGVDTIWSSPTFPSPNVDWGYDVSNYHDVHPELGTLDDLDTLIAEARKRDINIWLDLVPNHTSDKHDWFSDRPEYYVWRTRSRTTGSRSSPATPRGSTTRNASATTCTSSRRSSPTSTGGTPTCAPSSSRSFASGSTVASWVSASTSRTG